mmetsp:Transcript_29018/g.85871  ORF Transcript_29018/g.85871 Transcript_29018/m.85871 type:complete len:251 (+) Transcript_29018:2512-3264(+)
MEGGGELRRVDGGLGVRLLEGGAHRGHRIRGVLLGEIRPDLGRAAARLRLDIIGLVGVDESVRHALGGQLHLKGEVPLFFGRGRGSGRGRVLDREVALVGGAGLRRREVPIFKVAVGAVAPSVENLGGGAHCRIEDPDGRRGSLDLEVALVSRAGLRRLEEEVAVVEAVRITGKGRRRVGRVHRPCRPGRLLDLEIPLVSRACLRLDVHVHVHVHVDVPILGTAGWRTNFGGCRLAVSFILHNPRRRHAE